MVLNLDSLKKAIAVLGRSLSVFEKHKTDADKDMQETIRSGVIQNFEVTYEQCWKMIKRWLENNLGNSTVDGVSRRELFRMSAEHKLIDDVDTWMIYHDALNKTSHTYDVQTAADVFAVAQSFCIDAEKLLQNIESHND